MVELNLLLAPGSDGVLVLMQNEAERWTPRLVLRSDDYESMVGAIHNLYWALSAPTADGRFYLLEAHTHPWPTSRWRGFTYRALAPSTDANTPVVLAQGKGSGDWESGYELDAKQSGFTVRFYVSSDGPEFLKPARHVWKRSGDRFRQVSE